MVSRMASSQGAPKQVISPESTILWMLSDPDQVRDGQAHVAGRLQYHLRSQRVAGAVKRARAPQE